MIGRRIVTILLVLLLLVVGYLAIFMNWSYSSGERAGWVQKLSRKGWLCKTWEGELAMVSMPGAQPEKFYFTVLDDAVADKINEVMGRRVSLHYEQRVGLPTTCFGETRHYVTRVQVVDAMQLSPGIAAPVPEGARQPQQGPGLPPGTVRPQPGGLPSTQGGAPTAPGQPLPGSGAGQPAVPATPGAMPGAQPAPDDKAPSPAVR